ncbi:MAG TPA: amidase [Pirellulales bacterium]|jgi:aspartyl-tRNA(Asn)/glutamyl-tRNA(Gln) amidotransferase subunit A|nr:amidase [Pirellulales bacterium]
MDRRPNYSTIFTAAGQIRSGHLTAQELLQRCLAQIDAFESRVHAWVLVDEPGAREAARRADDEIGQGRDRGPLHGIPIGIKDLCDVAGWPTLAGSPLRAAHRAASDATVVARLREAGAIILGKTVTTEFASFDPPPTRNPWNLERTPGGSSSGSAAAVALGMCLGAIGSQTGGSITRPASFCGVAGCKPTFGRVSGQGVVPLSRHMDHVGPIARSVGDLAAMLGVIAGYDPADPTTVDVRVDDYVRACRGAPPPRLAILDEAFFLEGLFHRMMDAILKCSNAFEAAGAEVRVAHLPESFSEVIPLHRRIMTAEAAEYHQAMFREHGDRYGKHIGGLIEEGLASRAVDYAAALLHRRTLQRELLASFGDEIDALITPATTSTAPGVETTGDPKFNSPWSYVGYPTVSFPCGLADDGLPIALQFVGRPLQEARLLAAASWCEGALGFRPAEELRARLVPHVR